MESEGRLHQEEPTSRITLEEQVHGKEKDIRSTVIRGPARAQGMDNQNLPMNVAD